MLNTGILKIYTKEVTHPGGQAQKNHSVTDSQPLKFIKKAYFQDMSFTANEYYAAKESMVEIVRKVRIYKDISINSQCVIEIDSVFYDVGRTYTTAHKGVEITDITLEKVVCNYEIVGI